MKCRSSNLVVSKKSLHFLFYQFNLLQSIINMTAQNQIASYKIQIKNVLSQLRTEYENLNNSTTAKEENETISPKELQKLREMSKRLNEYCSDVMAYQEKISFLSAE